MCGLALARPVRANRPGANVTRACEACVAKTQTRASRVLRCARTTKSVLAHVPRHRAYAQSLHMRSRCICAVVACAQSLHVRIRCMGAFVAPAQHSARTAKSVQQFGRNDNAGHVVILLI